MKQYNRRNNNDDDDNDDDDNPPPTTTIFDPPPYYPSSPSKVDSDIKDNLNPTQKFLLGDRPEKGKIAVALEKELPLQQEKKKLDFRKILADYFQKPTIFLIIKKLVLMMTFLK